MWTLPSFSVTIDIGSLETFLVIFASVQLGQNGGQNEWSPRSSIKPFSLPSICFPGCPSLACSSCVDIFGIDFGAIPLSPSFLWPHELGVFHLTQAPHLSMSLAE